MAKRGSFDSVSYKGLSLNYPANSSGKGNERLGKTGGEAGIRTLGTAIQPYNGLANRRLKPLGHLSAATHRIVARSGLGRRAAFLLGGCGAISVAISIPVMAQSALVRGNSWLAG